jgi:hypothetical protein
VIRNEAEALAIGLRSGFANTSDAVRWADKVISMEQHPHGTICEVALAGNKRSSEVADLLDAIPGAPVHDVVMDLLIQLIHHKLEADVFQADSAARRLYYMAINDNITDPDLKSVARRSWDALHLADAGIIGNRKEVVSDLRNALSAADERAKARGHQWQH